MRRLNIKFYKGMTIKDTSKKKHNKKYDTPKNIGEKGQMDVKYVPDECKSPKIAGYRRFYQYTYIDEVSSSSFYEYGTSEFTTITSGRIVIYPESKVDGIYLKGNDAIIAKTGITILFAIGNSFKEIIFIKIGIYIAYNATIGNSEESKANHPTVY